MSERLDVNNWDFIGIKDIGYDDCDLPTVSKRDQNYKRSKQIMDKLDERDGRVIKNSTTPFPMKKVVSKKPGYIKFSENPMEVL